MSESNVEAVEAWVDGVSGWGTAMRGLATYLLGVGSRTLADWGGFVSPDQGGFGYSIDPIDGDPAQALTDIGGAPSSHVHSLSWHSLTAVTASFALDLTHVGKAILLNPTGPITVTLPAQATTAFSPGDSITLLNFSAQTVTVSAPTGVNVDGVAGPSTFDLVQHGFLNLVRLPANNLWNRSGSIA